ncbi:MAG: hypothetical protein F4Z31_07685 [Gemmatimonadetes bacterium]|nr:hypothetical protein [Gemmatimonadota bacterium]MYJ10057.1 hypothetical protein [Gemmatimonadota bacterium]
MSPHAYELVTYLPLAGWPGKGGPQRTVAVATDGLRGPNDPGETHLLANDQLVARQVNRSGRDTGRTVRIDYGRILSRVPAELDSAGVLQPIKPTRRDG